MVTACDAAEQAVLAFAEMLPPEIRSPLLNPANYQYPLPGEGVDLAEV